ncbi:EamA family transporter RarD [Cardiobacteriaceae bacterium TAE3-ERU3]|nr:EamA family transporter RarD [Cardiobacteriaceae bacterium TAE3-ERU3]
MNQMRAYLALWGCFLIWGLFPIYFSYMRPLRADEFLFARGVTSVLCLMVYFTWKGRWHVVLRDVLNRGMMIRCMCTAVFLAINWFTYIWAVQNDQTLQASFGYFITPIINVLFGLLLFEERLGRLQWAAIICAFAGVAWQLIAIGVVPWASLGIAFAWGIYGGLRKKFRIAPVAGLFNELLVILPFVLIGWGWLYLTGEGFDYRGHEGLLIGMLMSGVATVVPLLLFLYAVSDLPMTTVGITQYITPSIQFCIAVFLFQEPFDNQRLISFILIWIGLGLYSMHLIYADKDKKHVQN